MYKPVHIPEEVAETLGTPRREYQSITRHNLAQVPQIRRLCPERRFALRAVACVLPFRLNNYVVEELIDWERVPHDPIFQLTVPQRDMLPQDAFAEVAALLRRNRPQREVRALARRIHAELNPHPAGQMDENVPRLDSHPVDGMQHKYRETVLFFPTRGQLCHSFCTFCFRWPQFIGDPSLRFAANETRPLRQYLREHTEVTDVLITGGDPMTMSAADLRQCVAPLTAPAFEHVRNIRFGTKSLSFWPHRYVSDPDADDILRLFEDLVAAGKHVAVMAHFNHYQEMRTEVLRDAVRRIRATGAEIRSQSPLLHHINDDPRVWAEMWRRQVAMGIVPYYFFAARNTGARRYFQVPLVRAWEIYREAIRSVSGLCRTARGPSMSADPGKVEIQGVAEMNGEKVFVLRFLQARNPDWVQRPFFAAFDETAAWFDELRPAGGRKRFFFEED